jgi:predicted NUDIX family phosphoesterase
MDEEFLMCVKADDVEFKEGFTEFTAEEPLPLTHLHNLLMSSKHKARSTVESDESFKQIIVYIIVKDGDKIYRYARSGGEERLVGDYSVGIGGHVNVDDTMDADFSPADAVHGAAIREFEEEIKYTHDYNWSDMFLDGPIGVINDNSDYVGRVHLGVVFVMRMDNVSVVSKDENIYKAGMTDLDELMENLDDYEGWSQLLILEYLGRV